MPNYYYSPDGFNTVGPIDVNGLAALLRARTITRQTAAILEGQEEWATVGDYAGRYGRMGYRLQWCHCRFRGRGDLRWKKCSSALGGAAE